MISIILLMGSHLYLTSTSDGYKFGRKKFVEEGPPTGIEVEAVKDVWTSIMKTAQEEVEERCVV